MEYARVICTRGEMVSDAFWIADDCWIFPLDGGFFVGGFALVLCSFAESQLCFFHNNFLVPYFN